MDRMPCCREYLSIDHPIKRDDLLKAFQGQSHRTGQRHSIHFSAKEMSRGLKDFLRKNWSLFWETPIRLWLRYKKRNWSRRKPQLNKPKLNDKGEQWRCQFSNPVPVLDGYRAKPRCRLNIGIDLGPSSYPMNPGSFPDLGPSSYPFNPGSNPPNSPISFLANLFFY